MSNRRIEKWAGGAFLLLGCVSFLVGETTAGWACMVIVNIYASSMLRGEAL